MKKAFIILILLVIGACSAPSNKKYKDELDSQAFAKVSQGLERKIFPHPEGFKLGEVHGKYTFAPERMLQDCLKCHTESENKAGAKSCYECHDKSEIHLASSFNDANAHGPVALEKGYKTLCVKCHGDDLKGGKSGLSCSRVGCHSEDTGFPHLRSDMSRAEVHGPLFYGGQKTACLSCHAKNRSTDSKRSCQDSSCHQESSIHTSAQMREPHQHASAAIKNLLRATEDDKTCTKCHGQDLQGGNSGLTCYRSACHNESSGFIHASAKLKEGKVHGEFAFNKGIASCFTCHDSNDPKNRNVPSCYGSDCHNKSTLHLSKEFAPQKEHGIAVVKMDNTEKCQSCHGSDLKGGKSNKSCYGEECHREGEQFYHFIDYFKETKIKEKAIHGDYIPSGKLKDCLVCHSREVAAKNGFKPCFECHDNYMVHQGQDFRPPEIHGPAAFMKGINVCLECHGQEIAKKRNLKSCIASKCHDSASIHRAEQFKKPQAHGVWTLIKGSYSLCQKCHGQDLRGDIDKANKSCFKSDCHEGGLDAFYHLRSDFGIRQGGKKDETSHDEYSKGRVSECMQCHSVSTVAKVRIRTCAAEGCHDKGDKSFVHQLDGWVNKWDHGIAVLKKDNKYDGCRECHGSDLEGGKSGKSCWTTDCHKKEEGFYHLLADFGKKEVHGPIAKKAPEAMELKAMRVCAKCHGQDLKGGPAKKSCFDENCHKPESGFPHNKEGFRKGELHGALAFEKGYEACFKCHTYIPTENRSAEYLSSNLTQEQQGDNCFKKCHDGYSHKVWQIHRGGSKYRTGHAKFRTDYNVFWEFKTLMEFSEPCGQCHGKDLKGGKSGKTCVDYGCHMNYNIK